MLRMIIHGCSGAMGRNMAEIASGDDQVEVVAGVDCRLEGTFDFPVYYNLTDCIQEADVVVDFSSYRAVDALLDACVERKLPLVLGTTGLTDEQSEHVKQAAGQIPVLRSGNMSLGVNLMLKVVEEMAGVLLDAGFDPEIVEMHHNRKTDAPSGTALMLADAVNRAAGGTYENCLDRHERRQSRPRQEIGIQSVRGGTLAGEHEVLFLGPDEVIEIRHTANSRSIFANGALQAAKALVTRAPGLYDMQSVLFG